MTDRNMEVIALGARTPLGFSAQNSAAAVRAGISRVAEHPLLIDISGEALACARDPALEVTLSCVERMAEMAVSALHQAQQPLLTSHRTNPRVNTLLAVPHPRLGFDAPESVALLKAIREARCFVESEMDIQIIPGGHAAGFSALEIASIHLAEGRCDLCLVAGVDSYFDACTLDWLEAENRLARSETRGGFTPGEAAGVIAVTTRSFADRLGMNSIASIRTVAVSKEPRSLASDEGVMGEGLTTTIRRVTGKMQLPKEQIDDIYCDINGERFRVDEWGFALLRLPSLFRDPTTYFTGVASWGDVGAASTPLHCILAIQAWRRRYANGRRALVFGSSPQGLRGAAILEATS